MSKKLKSKIDYKATDENCFDAPLNRNIQDEMGQWANPDKDIHWVESGIKKVKELVFAKPKKKSKK